MEPKFVIQGVDYPVIGWDDFDMGEAEILTAKTGLTLIDLAEGDIPMTPGLLSTMMIVAYMRGNPNISRARAELVISKVKLMDAVEHIGGEDADAVPPSQTPTPDEPESSDASPLSSGDDSLSDSAGLQAVAPLPTGTSESATQPTSAPRISAS